MWHFVVGQGICSAESVSMRNTAMELFYFESAQERWLSSMSLTLLCSYRMQCITVAELFFCAADRNVSDNTSPNVLNDISCGAITIDMGPIFWWVLFTDRG